jgi:large subunit ribosomal protein L6
MSRIGKKLVDLPAGVAVTISMSNEVSIKGPKGTLTQEVNKDIEIVVEGATLEVKRPTNQIRHKALHGLYRSLLANMVTGVVDGYEKKLELVGVGYKASNVGNRLDLSLGYSHNILFEIPKELSISTLTEKGKNPIITLSSIDNQLLGAVCAKIKSLRKSEPYKGKGVKFVGEVIRKKAGKSAGK